MAREDNLKPFTSDQSHEAAVVNGRKGGIACAKARRRRKTMRELAEVMLNSKLQGKQAKGIQALCQDLDDEDVTVLSAIIAGQVKAAIGGSTRAAEWLASMCEAAVQDSEQEDELSRSLRELGGTL